LSSFPFLVHAVPRQTTDFFSLLQSNLTTRFCDTGTNIEYPNEVFSNCSRHNGVKRFVGVEGGEKEG
jgi:hypothetical protein